MAFLKLTVENGTYAYSPGNTVLQEINFSIQPGELMAILGPNGAGKTTLLRCLTGMLRWQSGRSLLDGEDIRSIPDRQLWRKMAYVPQAKAASSAYTAFETVLLGRSSRLNIFSSPKQEDLSIAVSVMEMLGISSLMEKKCSEMSGGELQMVLIARALAAEPEILILDEPESNLDFKNQLIILDLMSRLSADGIACIFNTHYPAHALQRAGKALLLHKGGAYSFGDTSAVVTEENIRKAFGVEAIIGEVETPENILRSVVPLRVAERADDFAAAAGDRRCIAAVTILTDDFSMAERINAILHEYRDAIIGRMGMPYKKCGLYMINTTLDSVESRVRSLTDRLNILQGVSVKTVFAKGDFEEAKP